MRRPVSLGPARRNVPDPRATSTASRVRTPTSLGPAGWNVPDGILRPTSAELRRTASPGPAGCPAVSQPRPSSTCAGLRPAASPGPASRTPSPRPSSPSLGDQPSAELGPAAGSPPRAPPTGSCVWPPTQWQGWIDVKRSQCCLCEFDMVNLSVRLSVGIGRLSKFSEDVYLRLIARSEFSLKMKLNDCR